ncbi:C-type lectin domain family 2 member B-like [Lithobates pipiens]
MRRLKKHKDPHHLCCQPIALLSLLVILKSIEIAVIYILVWKVPCDILQNSSGPSFANSTNRTSSSIPKHYYDAFDMISDLCAATGKVCELCPLNWVPFSGKCYFFSEDRKDWSSSRENCQIRNADILCMEDSAEEIFVSKQVTLKNGHFWVGLRKHTSEWIWETGGKYHKEPSITSNEHKCATFGRDMSAESCYNPNKWICEKNMTRYLT